ncbi:MAG: ABC transporter substrate-binding protein [Anaerolineae bacterium]|nr:ABC transporter substrate-binding protein [Anaerolineae bacterium]MDW8100920.1 ABC transporter substrate-binding protein [Anaerolineae bacterium]
MKTRELTAWLLLAVLVLLVACAAPLAPVQEAVAPTATQVLVATPQPTATPIATPQVLTANITEGGVESFDERVDYFPEKVVLKYSEGWEVEYHNNYKVIRVLNPWRDATETFVYVLVQRGTPKPDGYEGAYFIEVPIETIITMSTTYLPHLDILGVLDRLIGIDGIKYVNNETVRKMFAEGRLVEIGSGAEVNVEAVLDLGPDVVMTYAVGSPDYDAHPKLVEAGITTVLNAEYMETSPLGRAEWIKFTAMFFNLEGKANAAFEEIAQQYEEMAAKAREVTERPTVFCGTPYQNVWYMPGGRSYVARLLADAGADYLWSDDESTGSIPLDFETVFARAVDADYWINTGQWKSIDEALAADERFADFAALKNQKMYNNNARLNEAGGNDYWESGVVKPHLVLADLIKIFHPELVPGHEFIYYRKLDPPTKK